MYDLVDLRTLVVTAVIFLTLEAVAPLHKRPVVRRGFGTDLVYYVANVIPISLAMVATITALMFAARLVTPSVVPSMIETLPLWIQVPLVFLVADVGFYAAHRMFHAVPFLWRFHAIHHSSEKLDWLAAHRVHPVDQVITKSASIVPLFALGFSEAAIAFWGIVYQWQSVYVHANCRIGLGPLGWLVATPHFHHWHHANHKEAWDRNFAGQLPFIDALFGTLYLPAGRMPERYGIDEPVPEHYVQQLLHPILPPSAGTAPTATEPHP